MLYQLSYTPRLQGPIVSAAVRHHPRVGRFAMPALFSVLTLAFVVIAVSSATHARWVIAVASAIIAVWMGSFALASIRKRRR